MKPTDAVAWALRATLAAALAALASASPAADPARGAALYLQLPSGAPGCIACHGADPAQNRNSLLNAADRPLAVLKALSSVAAMGYVKSEFGEAEVNDVAAYLGRVLAAGGPGSTVAVWPPALDFGTATLGAATPAQQVRLRNRGSQALALYGVALAGDGFSLAHDCPQVLAVEQECSAAVAFASGTPGARAAALVIVHGTGERSVVGLGVRISPGATGVLEVDPPGPRGFAPLAPGETATRIVALVNRGTRPVVVHGGTLTGPDSAAFAIDDGDCAGAHAIEPGGRCHVRITWSPMRRGDFASALHWRSDGQNAPPLHVAATASRPLQRQPPQPPGRVAAMPCAARCGSRPAGSR